MADDVQFTLNADSTPPAGTLAATDEITVAGPHLNAHAGIAKLAVSANGDGTHLPATAADGLLVNLGANNDVTVTGTVTANTPTSGTATRTTVADNAADILLLAANAAREKYSVTNDSTAVLYLADGGVAASLTNYTVQIPPNAFYSNEAYKMMDSTWFLSLVFMVFILSFLGSSL